MMSQASESLPHSEYGDLLRQLERGEPQARDRLIERAQDRLRLRIHQMLNRFPTVHRWENTSDVLQEVLIQLHHTLSRIQPRDSKHFVCLAALHIRRKLLDLARSVGRLPRCEADLAPLTDNTAGPIEQASVADHDPLVLAQWTEIHRYIEELPETERDLFDVLFYHGMGQEEAAAVLGMSYRTLKRHWQAVRIAFMERFGVNPFAEKDLGPKA